MRYETNIEVILDLSVGNEEEVPGMLNVLKTYLGNGAEDLTLEQYKRVRACVEKNYRSMIGQALSSGELTKESVDEVGHLFTDYLRNQHYKLLDEYKGVKQVADCNEKLGWKQRLKGCFSRFKGWKKQDDNLYNLERALWTGEGLENERDLVNNINPVGLSKYKLKTLERILPRTKYKSVVQRTINKYNQGKLINQYRTVMRELRQAI